MQNMGVYKITNIDNGKVYVGSSKNLKNRLNRHLWYLKKNTHSNSHLQRAWNKYGEDKFEFSVLEFVPDVNILLEREQHYMNLYLSYKRDFGYNILPIAGSSENMTEETRQKMSKSHKGQRAWNKGIPQTQEVKDKLSKSQKGRPAWNKGIHRTQETRDKISKYLEGKPRIQEDKDKIAKSLSKNWVVIDPMGKEYNITNLRKFCRENNLHSGAMVEVSKGKCSQHKGWQCKKLEDK